MNLHVCFKCFAVLVAELLLGLKTGLHVVGYYDLGKLVFLSYDQHYCVSVILFSSFPNNFDIVMIVIKIR